MTNQPNKAFSARDVFDPRSDYNRMRSCFREELKLRGLFYELQAAREANPQVAGRLAAAHSCKMVVFADDPAREIEATIVDKLIPARDKPTELKIMVRLIGE